MPLSTAERDRLRQIKTFPSLVKYLREELEWPIESDDFEEISFDYTAEALGKAEEIDDDFFNEIHMNRNLLETEEKLAAFFAKHGVDAAAFKSTFNSFAVNTKLQRAEEHIGRYRVSSTPTVVINGKYTTMGRQAGSYDAWFAIIDDLAAREHAGGSAAAQ